MIGSLLPFLMFGILAAAVLARPMSRQSAVSLPVAIILLGFISSETWVWLGQDTGLPWENLRDLVFYLLLPVLIFEAAVNFNVRRLRRESLLVFGLAVPLLMVSTMASAVIIQFMMGGMLGNIWALTILCGAMISATDPATVGKILNGVRSHGRVVGILEGESLINDATTITLFVMSSAILTIPGDDLSFQDFAIRFVLVLLGSILVGLTIAWLQRKDLEEKDVAFAFGSWRTFGFLADAMLFFLVGMSITVEMFRLNWFVMLVGILAAIVSRAVIIFLGTGPLLHLPRQSPLSMAQQNLMLWGGVRGAVAIALALSLSVEIPYWYTIQSMVYGVALFSLTFQTPVFAYLSQRTPG